MVVLVMLALVVAVVGVRRGNTALKQAREAERKANLLREEVLELRARLGLPPSWRLGQGSGNPLTPTEAVEGPQEAAPPSVATPTPAPAPQESAPMPPLRPVWPEDQPLFAPSPPPAAGPVAAAVPGDVPGQLSRQGAARPSLWGPEFSRARISVFGGALVLSGLAFTLRALGLPAWTLLLAVFAFGVVLYSTARLVPWPVSGALRGLGYGVTALGIGSLSQKLPHEWGPGAVLLGLLGLSAGLTWDSLRRREPLLGVMAVAGASLSVWMLTDDLGRLSILAAGLVFLLVTAAVAGGRAFLADAEGPTADMHTAETSAAEGAGLERPDAPQAWRTALTLVLGLAGTLPVGWFVASASHVLPRPDLAFEIGEVLPRHVMTGALFLEPEPRTTLLLWLGFALLALLPGVALLRGQPHTPDADQVHDGGLRFGAVWATFTPQALLALATGVALSRRNFAGEPPDVGVLVIALLGLLALALTAWWAWKRHRQHANDPEDTLAGTLSSSLTAGATGVAAAILVALLGARTEPSALAGLALTLLLVGVYGRSRLWVWLGALGLAVTALWGLDTPDLPGQAQPWTPLLRALPALTGLLGALRAAWWRARQPEARTPSLTWLAGLCSADLLLALSSGSVWFVLAGTGLLTVLVWAADRFPHLPDRVRPTLYWAGLPGLLVGAAQLLLLVEPDLKRWPLVLGSGVAAGVALLSARRAGTAQPLVEGLALGLIVFGLALLPEGKEPHLTLALALVALLAAALPLKLHGSRVLVLLGLGVFGLFWPLLENEFGPERVRPLEWLGAWALLAVGWLTQGEVSRQWLLQRLPAPDRSPLSRLPLLSLGVQTWWFALYLGLAMTAGVFLFPQASEWWLLAGSVAALLVGVSACVRAARQDNDHDGQARARWTAGLWLVVAAGLKGATLDALGFSNPRAVAGLAVLVTGLSLLLLAVLAPRPAGAGNLNVAPPEKP